MQDCAWHWAHSHYPDALVVHRLDMATSGLLLFARGLTVQRQMSRAFALGEVEKSYQALVHPPPAARWCDGQWRTIDLPLTADWPRRPRQKVCHLHGKPSQTRWRVLETLPGDVARVELQPLSGRTHQLRVHLASIGHPIVGDALYGAPLTAPRLMLHALSLHFTHPALTDQYVTLTSANPLVWPLPTEFSSEHGIDPSAA